MRGVLAQERPRMLWAGETPGDGSQVKAGYAGKEETRNQVYWAGPRIAILPIYNLTTAPAPLKAMESMLTNTFEREGVSVLDKDILEKYMSSQRLRYTGGLDSITAAAMKEGTGVESALVSTLEFYSEDPPKLSMHARLVSTGSEPEIQWIDSVCMTGDDAPGILNLGVVNDPLELIEIMAHRLASSLILHLTGTNEVKDQKMGGEGFHPTYTYRSQLWKRKAVSKVAVAPFMNLSERSYAWEILPLHFVKQMVRLSDFKVLEPGVVRRELLRSRVVVEGGLTKPDLEIIQLLTKAELVLTGSVMEYSDSNARGVDPMVEFSVQVFDETSKEVVWSSRSVGTGGDNVHFFGVGQRSTACGLAEDLTRAVVKEMTTGN